jgi:hypothetical protein
MYNVWCLIHLPVGLVMVQEYLMSGWENKFLFAIKDLYRSTSGSVRYKKSRRTRLENLRPYIHYCYVGKRK